MYNFFKFTKLYYVLNMQLQRNTKTNTAQLETCKLGKRKKKPMQTRKTDILNLVMKKEKKKPDC